MNNLESKNVIDINEQKCDLIDDIKFINRKLKDCVNNFIEIGFKLKEIKESKSYELLEYENINEFSKVEFGLNSTSVKNYIAVAIKFGDDEYECIKDEYKDYSLTQLVELLPVSEDIDSYSPNMTVKEIRSQKLISQLTDYKRDFIYIGKETIENYIETVKVNYKFDVRVRSENIYIYTTVPNRNWDSLSIYFCDGYYSIESVEFYDLNIDLFKENLLLALEKYIEKMNKYYDEYIRRKAIEKKERLAALPENEKGISEGEKAKRVQQRLDDEEIDRLFKQLKKNKNIDFLSYISSYTGSTLLCFHLFKELNKINLNNYKLIYMPKVGDLNFVGVINGLDHFRIFDRYILEYDPIKESWNKVFDLDEFLSKVITEYDLIFGRLFNDRLSENVKPYLSDVRSVIKRLDTKEFN